MRRWTKIWLMVLLSVSLLHQSVLAAPEDAEWTRTFKIGVTDDTTAVATHSSGIYSVGTADFYAFVTRYDASGKLLWAQSFTSPAGAFEQVAEADDVAVDDTGVYVAGGMARASNDTCANYDALVRKYTHQGRLLWTRFIAGGKASSGDAGCLSTERARGIAVDSTGVYVVGETDGSVAEQENSGSGDIFLRKYTTGGRVVWTRQDSTGDQDHVSDIALDPSGVLLTGQTYGTWPGQTKKSEFIDMYVRKYSRSGAPNWTRQFGTPDGEDSAASIAAHGTNIYVGGYTYGDLSSGRSGTGEDTQGFVRKYQGDGTLLWTRQFGTSGGDEVLGLAADSDRVYASGVTWGAFPGFMNKDGRNADAFATSFSCDGTRLWIRQFGTGKHDWGNGIAVRPPPTDSQQEDWRELYVGGSFDADDVSGGDAFLRKYLAKQNFDADDPQGGSDGQQCDARDGQQVDTPVELPDTGAGGAEGGNFPSVILAVLLSVLTVCVRVLSRHRS